MTYREKLEDVLISQLGVNPHHAKEIVELIEKEGQFIPSAFKVLNAPDTIEDWNKKIPCYTTFEEKTVVGRIEWLRTNGRVRELREFSSLETLINDAATELEYGVPVTIVIYDNCSEEEYKKACNEIVNKSGAIPSGGFEYENIDCRITYYRKLWSDQCTFKEFFHYVDDMGKWDNVNSREDILNYVKEKIEEDVRVSHILEAIEDNPFDELFNIWLGNSAETPTPIRTKFDLVEALGLSHDDLDVLILSEYVNK